MKGFLRGVLKLVFIAAYIGIGMKLQTDWEEMWDYFIVNPVLNAIADLAFFAVLLVGFIILWVLFFVDTKKKKSSTTQSQRPAQTAKPSTTYTTKTTATQPTAAQVAKITADQFRSAQKPTPKPAAAQPRPAQKPTPKPAAKPVNNSSKKIAVDYVKAIPGALKGLIPGFALFFVFGLINDFTNGSNTLTTLAVLSFFGCPIIGYISALNDQPGRRKLKADEQAHADDLEKRLKANLDILNQGCGVTQESISRYDTACDNLIHLISWNFFDSRYKHILDPYRHAVYERTWPVFNWRNGKYEVAVGEELADRLHNAIEKRANERKEEYERKMRNIR